MKAPQKRQEPRGKKRTTPLPELLTALAPVVRPAMLEHFSSDCCIATCTVLRHVLHTFGYNSYPVPVSVAAYNLNMIRILQQGNCIPDDHGERLKFFKREHAWGVGIGVGDPLGQTFDSGRGFDGHLVLRVQGALVDASIQQVERIDKGILIGPLVTCKPGIDFFQSEEHPEFPVSNVSCVLAYRRIEDSSYMRAHDWRGKSKVIPAIEKKIILETRERLLVTKADAV